MSSSQNKPQVFTSPDGSSLPVFVESNGVSENRPRLIRTLRSHGANICVDVSLARIILVEPSSSEGRQFVRDWGMDPGKVILDIAWVNHCLKAGRPLLENDDWAGCGNLDGTPLPGDVVDDEASERPPSISSSKRATSHKGVRRPSGTSPSIPPLPTPRQTPTGHVSSHGELYSADPHPTPTSQRPPTPPPLSSSFSYPVQTSETQAQQSLPGLPQFANSQFTPQAMQSLLMTNPELMAAAMGMVMQAMSQPPSSSSAWPGQPLPSGQHFMPPPSAFPQNLSPPQMPMPQQMSGHPFIPAMQNQSQQMNSHYAHTYNDISAHRDQYSSPTIDPGPRFDSPRQSISPRLDPTDIQDRMSQSPSLPASPVIKKSILSQKGKKRSRDSSDSVVSSKLTRYSQSPSASSGRRREKKRSPSTEPVRSRVKKDKAAPVGIFTARNGSPMKFFLQVQIRNRIDLVHQVKKNGGQITFEPMDADYIILTPHATARKVTEQWMNVVEDLKRTALRPGFIEACLEENAIVEEEDFRLEKPAKLPKPAKPAKKRTSAKVKPPQKDTVEDISPSRGNLLDSDGNLRSPTLPAANTEILTGNKHAFTTEEKAYALKHAEYTFRKRPDATLHFLGTEIARRVTTHSTASWINTLYTYRAEVEKIRDEVAVETGIETEKPESEEPEGGEATLMAKDVENSQTVVRTGSRDGNGEEQSDDGEKELARNVEVDFKTIIDYFANPPDGLSEDEQLWAGLETKYKCVTAPTWQDFYELRMQDVNLRLRKALNLPEAEAEQSEDTVNGVPRETGS
ncbi:hypothetical protein M0805_002326 [Coniferiporia weirii]|nr:hypothetical protein M0805_002326 [Coniferiporia weirii]